jgi:hypothetical protein
MRNVALLLSIFIFTALSCDQKQKGMINKLDKGKYGLSHGMMSIIIDAEAGGRVTSAQSDGKEVLLQHRDGLLNWGSTFWPAPQSIWKWPPPKSIFSNPYKVEVSEDKLVLESGIDPKYRLSARKEFQINKQQNCLEITYYLKNESDESMSVGPWEISCAKGTGGKIFFMNGEVPKGTTNNFNFPVVDGVAWLDYDKAELEEKQKHFNNSNEGWLAYISDRNVLFVKSFEVIKENQIAPAQGNIEVYIDSQMDYIELENHGKYQQLEPGESLEYKVRWFLIQLPSHLKSDKFPSQELIDFTRDLIDLTFRK